MDIASRQPARLRGSPTTVATAIAGARAAIANLRSSLAAAQPELDLRTSKALHRAALDKALARASGTWGGYQAAPPLNYRASD